MALLLVVFSACNETTDTDDDSASDADDDEADDDAGDDDAGDDDAGDDDAGDDDAGDDDGGDDDGGDDDTAGSGDCTVLMGESALLSGHCEADPASCTGGFFPQDQSGTCTGGMTCCIDPDQCETTLMTVCVATSEECEGEPPNGNEFPQFGCPPPTPYCCVTGGGP